MALHAISVFDMVFNEALKIVNYKNIIKGEVSPNKNVDCELKAILETNSKILSKFG